MSEQPIVWIGKKPRSMETRETAVEPAEFESLLSEAMGSCSFDYQDHVIAHGEHGSWLVNLERDGCRHRVVWNGKSGTMVLEKATSPSGWEELASVNCEVSATDSLVAELQNLLEASET